MEALYEEFLLTDNNMRAAVSRKFLPLLREKGPDREFLLKKLQYRQNMLYQFDFTWEEFELLEPEKYGSSLLGALAREKYDLAYAIGKATGKYGICCRFDEETSPRQILEVLNAHLDKSNIATCYIERADLNEMLRYGLIPCPYVGDMAKMLLDPGTLELLEYHREGLTEKEIEYWTGTPNYYEELCKVGFWSLVTKEYCLEAVKKGNSYRRVDLLESTRGRFQP